MTQTYNYLEQALDLIPTTNNLSLKPGQKDLEDKFKTELDTYDPDFNPIMKMKMIFVFSSLIHQGLTSQMINELSNQGVKFPLLTTLMLTLVQIMLINKGVTPEQMTNNFGLLNRLVFSDREIDCLYNAITNH